MKTHTVLAIGAHVGDAELTAGALLATCAVHGGKAVTLALTAGEKGAPIGADIAAYRADKIAQAEAFARDSARRGHQRRTPLRLSRHAPRLLAPLLLCRLCQAVY